MIREYLKENTYGFDLEEKGNGEYLVTEYTPLGASHQYTLTEEEVRRIQEEE